MAFGVRSLVEFAAARVAGYFLLQLRRLASGFGVVCVLIEALLFRDRRPPVWAQQGLSEPLEVLCFCSGLSEI